jgi:RsmE family RNA methyltransferase
VNLLILEKEDFTSSTEVHIRDRRHRHMLEVQKLKVGDSIRAGELNGRIGSARVDQIDSESVSLSVDLQKEPPNPLPATLLLALPRPKMLKRTFQTLAAMGVKEIYLVNAYRVDKSYWSTPVLSDASIREHLILGLEQAGDTRLPNVHIRKRFKPFVEDELPSLVKGKRSLIAHPYNASLCPEPSNEETLIAIGPEGGFIPYEVDLMEQQGLQAIHLGERILRVETAVPVLLSRLFPII